MNGAATSPKPRAGAGCAITRGRGPIHAGRPRARRESTPHHRRTLDLNLPIEGPARPLDLDGAVDRSRAPLDLNLPLDRPAARSRDRRVPLHGLAADRPAWIHQAAAEKNQGEDVLAILHGHSPPCEPTTSVSGRHSVVFRMEPFRLRKAADSDDKTTPCEEQNPSSIVLESVRKAPEIRTYVVPLDNIWSGSAF